jgi:hydroxyacylglutathione hydrolase
MIVPRFIAGQWFLWTLGLSAFPQSPQVGPYTVHRITEEVYRIEDANDDNPSGAVLGDDGQMISMNNCSDIYLIVGGEKALLIDLSNDIQWHPSAAESLRQLVFELTGDKALFISVTHKHGDHLGMLPAFAEDPQCRFWIPGNEFSGTNIFPDQRTAYFEENASLDLGGGLVVNTLEVPGHTPHSTLFFLRGRNLVFSGDAIGSGSGVWLFNEESFYTYRRSIDNLIRYLEDGANGMDPAKLRIYGGHYWQCKALGELTVRYIYDMRALIGEMSQGRAEEEEMSSFIEFLDTNFRYGTATITWNREAAAKFAESIPLE